MPRAALASTSRSTASASWPGSTRGAASSSVTRAPARAITCPSSNAITPAPTNAIVGGSAASSRRSSLVSSRSPPGNVSGPRHRSGRDQELARAQRLAAAADRDRVRIDETRASLDDVDPLAQQIGLHRGGDAVDEGALARDQRRPVERWLGRRPNRRAETDRQPGCAPHQIRDLARRREHLLGHASAQRTGAAHVARFDDRHAPSGGARDAGGFLPGVAGADDDQIIRVAHGMADGIAGAADFPYPLDTVEPFVARAVVARSSLRSSLRSSSRSLVADSPPIFRHSLRHQLCYGGRCMEVGFFETIARDLSGTGQFRLILQPLAAFILGVRLGIADARAGKDPFLHRMVSHRHQCWPTFKESLSDAVLSTGGRAGDGRDSAAHRVRADPAAGRAGRRRVAGVVALRLHARVDQSDLEAHSIAAAARVKPGR